MSERSLLLVEDNDSIARAYQLLLRAHGWRVEHRQTRSAALAALKQERFPAAVVDLHLRDGSGLDVVDQHVHAAPSSRCLLATGDLQALDRLRCLPPTVRLLPKPFGAHELLEALGAPH